MGRRRWLAVSLCWVGAIVAAPGGTASERPNILVFMADNWLYDHAGSNGNAVVKTPVFDRIAREGARFTHAFGPVPSCSPTRASIFTGRVAHQLEELANFAGRFDGKFRVFADALAVVGYQVGYTGKGWGHERYWQRTVTPLGQEFASFAAFLDTRAAERPFFFWVGETETALRYWKPGSGAAAGIDPAEVHVPGHLPDTAVVREEIADYLASVQRSDAAFGHAIALLEARGELENTIIIYTSDNGWQMPRGLANVYDAGTHVPLAVRWPGRVRPGLVIDDFISLTDLAPTILEMAGLYAWPEMTGRSFADVLTGQPSAVRRDAVFLERERHANVRRGDLSYPIRAVRTKDYLYIRNMRPNRWPAGDPKVYISVGDYGDIDPSRTKAYMREHQDDPAMQRLFALSFKKRPAEELYELQRDRDQINSVADRPEFAVIKQQLREKLDTWMAETDDPRVDPDYDEFDTYPYYGGTARELRRWEAEKPVN